MRARIAASVVLAAGILMGTSACNLLAPQATTNHYDASDGVSGTVGDIAVRNAILISDGATSANLLVTIVNTGDSARNLSVQYTAAGQKVTQQVTVAPKATVSVGTPDVPAVTLANIDAKPGALFPVFMQYGQETGVELLVPVLDGTLGQYSTLVPTATPTPTAQTPTPAVTPTPTPTP